MVLMKGRPAVAPTVLGNNHVVSHSLESKMKSMFLPQLSQITIEGKCLPKDSVVYFICTRGFRFDSRYFLGFSRVWNL